MFKLIVKKTGRQLKELSLKGKSECFIGRGADNDIVLPEPYGLSRKHLQVKQTEDGQWTVINLSQTSPLVLNGEETAEGVLEAGQSFYVQSYEFMLVKEEPLDSEPQAKAPKENEGGFAPLPLPAAAKGGALDQPPAAGAENKLTPPGESENLSSLPALAPTDKTTIMERKKGPDQLSAYLKISAGDDSPQDVFTLEGAAEWTVGRDKSCSMIVDSPNMSRKHFKIQNKNGQYYITDLNSSNGTILNSRELSPGKPYLIQTNDIIYILNIEMLFEIKNPALLRELAVMKAPAPIKSAAAGAVMLHTPEAPRPDHLPNVIVENSEEDMHKTFFKKYKKRIMIYAAGVGVGLWLLLPNSQPEPASDTIAAAKEGELAGLTHEIIQVVKDSYQAAKELFLDDKFAHCLSELQKVHKYTESYRDSQTLKSTCAAAAHNERKQKDIEQRKKKEQETDQKIQAITSECKQKFKTFKHKSQLTDCLSEAMHISSVDQRVQSLILQFEFEEKRKEDAKKAQAARRAKVRKMQKKYTLAKNLHNKGQLKAAMAAYQKFLNSGSGYKELNPAKQQAKRGLASVKKSYQDNINSLNSRCNQLIKAGQFKSAYLECETASQKIPEPANKHALKMMKQAAQQLKTRMKPLYEAASLHESTGNITTAKEKWQEILKQDVQAGLYYQRAKIKINKY